MEDQNRTSRIAVIVVFPFVIIMVLALGIISGWKLFETTKTGSILMWIVTLSNAIELIKTVANSAKKNAWVNLSVSILIFAASIYILLE